MSLYLNIASGNRHIYFHELKTFTICFNVWGMIYQCVEKENASLSLSLSKNIMWVAFDTNAMYLAWAILFLSLRAQEEMCIQHAFQIEVTHCIHGKVAMQSQLSCCTWHWAGGSKHWHTWTYTESYMWCTLLSFCTVPLGAGLFFFFLISTLSFSFAVEPGDKFTHSSHVHPLLSSSHPILSCFLQSYIKFLTYLQLLYEQEEVSRNCTEQVMSCSLTSWESTDATGMNVPV